MRRSVQLAGAPARRGDRIAAGRFVKSAHPTGGCFLLCRGVLESPDTAEMEPVNARSALFDLYGDHLLSREGQAPVASLVRCMRPLDVAAPAVRTAVSRMVK